jgi:(p)ppGpp synthase/HD superfamily hydrolase
MPAASFWKLVSGVSYLMIEHCFGPDVVSIVKILSKAPKEGYLERFAMCKDWRPYVIKACDRLDNLRSLSGPTITEEFRQRQIKETEEKYLPLFVTMVELTPKRCKPHAEFLLKQILDQLKELKDGRETHD